MKVEKIDHIAIRVKDAKKATKFFADLFETEFSEFGVNKGLDTRNFIDGDGIGIEIVEPLTPDGATTRAIERRGEGLSLLALKVSNFEEAVAEMKSRGIRQVGAGKLGTGERAALFHPKDTYGVLIALAE